MLFGDGDQCWDVQIPLDRQPPFGRADQIRLIGLEPVQREAVFVGVDRDGPQSQLGGGPKHANGDFTSIGDKQLPHHIPVNWRVPGAGKIPAALCETAGDLQESNFTFLNVCHTVFP